MKINVLVKPNSRKPGVEKLPTGEYRVQVNAPPQEGRANTAVLEALAEFLGVPRSRLRIVLGHSGKKKVIEILD